MDCFERDKATKAWRLLNDADRPEGWREALASFDGSIAKINAGRKKKNEGKLLTPLAGGANANPHSTHRRRRIHADGDGAFNAIRKVCPSFACSSKVNLGHDILMLRSGSWRLWAPPGTA